MATEMVIATKTPVLDWARVYDYQLQDGGDALASRLRIWLDMQTRLGRKVVLERIGETLIRDRDGDVLDISFFGEIPGYVYRAFAVADIRPLVHTYKGEGLTACGLEVVGPCPDCERVT